MKFRFVVSRGGLALNFLFDLEELDVSSVEHVIGLTAIGISRYHALDQNYV